MLQCDVIRGKNFKIDSSARRIDIILTTSCQHTISQYSMCVVCKFMQIKLNEMICQVKTINV